MNWRRASKRTALWSVCLLPAGFAFAQTPPVFSAEEQRWIAQHPVVRYVADTRLAPLEYTENGLYKGLIAEYLEAVARKSGLRFERVPTQNWEDAQQAFLDGRADLFPNVNAQRTRSDVGAQLRLTDPYFLAPTIIVTRTDAPIVLNMKDLDGKVAAIRGGGSYAQVFGTRYPKVRALPVDEPGDGLDAVVDGMAYAAIGTDAVFLPMMRRRYAGLLSISGTVGELLYSAHMGVRADRPLLYAVIEKSLRSLSAEETDQMNERWLEQTNFGEPSLLSIVRYRLPQLLLVLAGMALLGWFAYRARVAQRAAQESERTKSRFLAVMSHEIRTPMNAVLASIEMLQREPMDARQQRFTQTAAVAAESLLTLLDDVLDLSKPDARRLELELVPTDVDALAQKVAHVARVNAQAKALVIEVVTDNPSGRRIVIDPTRLRQILLNLLGNAVKFTDRGRIDVRLEVLATSEAQGTLAVSVGDTEVGIAPAQQATIFDAYAQADKSTTRRYGGTGLGLTICRELVELMGGTIRLRSRSGVGTSVDFTLPVRLAPPATASAEDTPEATGTPAAHTRATVLLVEDHPANQFIIAEQLRTLGYEAQIVGDGDAALRALAQRAFDLVLMDCHMPGLSGYDTTLRIREREGDARHTPVIAVSAATDAAHLERCMESGMDGVLKKPLRLDDLSSMLQLWVGPTDAATGPAAGRQHPAPHPPLPSMHGEMQNDLVALRRALAADDPALAAHHAHRLRGAALMSELAAVSAAAEALESIARATGVQGDTTRIAALLDRLTQALSESADGRPQAPTPGHGGA